MKNVIEIWQKIVIDFLDNKSVCVDATMGNGNDSLFLLSQNIKFLYAFDIQEAAIKKTKEKIMNFDNYKLILDSHENMRKYINEVVDFVIFNFGYLPNGNKEITTMCSSSLKGVFEAMELIRKKGLIALVFYPGHSEGKKEAMVIKEELKKVDQKLFNIIEYNFINQINNPPFLITIEKL